MYRYVLDMYFWKAVPLEQMSEEQWESLCDGCGKCCLNKFIDEETDELYFTWIACDLLSKEDCSCSDYVNRFKKVPDCLKLTPQMITEFYWLPDTCAYRLISEGKDLPAWHPLVAGTKELMYAQGISVRENMVYEIDVIDWEDYIIYNSHKK